MFEAVPRRGAGGGDGSELGWHLLANEQRAVATHRPAEHGAGHASLEHGVDRRQQLGLDHRQRIGATAARMPVVFGATIDRDDGEGEAERCDDIVDVDGVERESMVIVAAVQTQHDTGYGCIWWPRHCPRNGLPQRRAVQRELLDGPTGFGHVMIRAVDQPDLMQHSARTDLDERDAAGSHRTHAPDHKRSARQHSPSFADNARRRRSTRRARRVAPWESDVIGPTDWTSGSSN